MAEHLAYPDTIGNDVKQGQHYVLFSSYESKSAVAASTIVKSSIALYIPPNSLSTTIQQNYQELEGGATRAVLGAGKDGGGMTDAISNMFSVQGITDIQAILQGQTAKVKQFADFRAAGTGLATNNHVALTYRGPQGFRDHSFVFQFFPKSNPEAEAVRKIIEDFQNGATPRRAGGLEGTNRLLTPYFASPRQWVIKFIMGKSGGGGSPGQGGSSSVGENPYLPKIKRSVITSFAVNHDPESVVSFHADGSPVHSTLTMTFKEIEHVISGYTVSEQFNSDAAVLDASENQALRRFRPDLAENG